MRTSDRGNLMDLPLETGARAVYGKSNIKPPYQGEKERT